MKGSLIIVGFFVLGIIVGLCHFVPQGFLDSDVSYYALCALMFCVGISIGCDTSVLKSFRKVNPRLMFLPVMTIVGTLAGCAAASLVLGHRQLTDCLPSVRASDTIRSPASSSPSIVDRNWAPSPCSPTSAERYSRCSVHRSWLDTLASWHLSVWVEPPQWIPRCPSSPVPRASSLSSSPSSMDSV